MYMYFICIDMNIYIFILYIVCVYIYMHTLIYVYAYKGFCRGGGAAEPSGCRTNPGLCLGAAAGNHGWTLIELCFPHSAGAGYSWKELHTGNGSRGINAVIDKGGLWRGH